MTQKAVVWNRKSVLFAHSNETWFRCIYTHTQSLAIYSSANMCVQRIASVSHCISSLFVIVALHKLFVFPTILHIGIKKYRETKNCPQIHKRTAMSLKFWKFSTVFMFCILNYIIAAYLWWSSAAQWHQIVTGPYFNWCLSPLELVVFFSFIKYTLNVSQKCIFQLVRNVHGFDRLWLKLLLLLLLMANLFFPSNT